MKLTLALLTAIVSGETAVYNSYSNDYAYSYAQDYSYKPADYA